MNSECCTDLDCPSDPTGHRHGACGASRTCSYACDTGFRACGGACIPNGSCCSNAECTSPPNGCFKAAGTCAQGTCSYAYNDGAACNADNDACTPNDKCMSGSCVADTANRVKCTQRECHTAPSCNTTTGNCDDTPLGDGTMCGGNGCTAAGTCTAGGCSSPTKDCSSLDDSCKVGLCDPSLSAPNNCATTNKLNGLACNLADKCQQAPACNGGACVGTPKTCSTSTPCHVAACNPSTGGCDEAVAPVGTPCVTADSCRQSAVCDATGACKGDAPLPDGTPCEQAGCTGNAACVTGACTCVGSADNGSAPQPLLSTDAGLKPDPAPHSGCAFVRPRGDTPAAVGLFCLLLLIAGRRKPRSSKR
jgi:hypothetical protein